MRECYRNLHTDGINTTEFQIYFTKPYHKVWENGEKTTTKKILIKEKTILFKIKNIINKLCTLY